MPIPHSGRNPRTVSISPSTVKPNRAGDVLDSLVIMIAGLLLPAWLLGHLFLTFYPAPDVVSNSEDGKPDIAVVVESDATGGENTPAGSLLTNNNATSGNGSSEAGTDAVDAFEVQLQSMTEKFDSLTQTSVSLESEVAALKQSNAALVEENSTLKTQATSAMRQDGSPVENNSTALNELQTKYDATSVQLETTKQSLQDATTRLNSVEDEKRTLQNDLANAQARIEQTESKLTAAVASGDSNMEIKPESDSVDSPFALLAQEENSRQSDLAAEAKAKIVELEQQLQELRLDLSNTNNLMAAQKKELAAQKQELQSTQNELSTIEAQNNNLKVALNAAKDKAVETELPKEIFRDFVSSKGSVSKMAFIRWEGEAVIVRSFENKKLYRLTMDRFSKADQQFLQDQKK